MALCVPSFATAQPAEVDFCEQKLSVDVQEIQCEDALLVDLSGLAQFSKLKKLFLEADIENPDFSVLAGLKNLEELALYRVDLPNLDFVRSLPKLRSLKILQNSPFRDLVGLGFATSLKDLAIHSNETAGQALDLSPLAALTQLESLSIDVTTKDPMDLSFLGQLKGLTSLRLSGAFTSLVPTTKLSKIVSLYLTTEQLVDIEGYAPLKALTSLGVRSSKISVAELNSFTKKRPKVKILGCKMILDPPCAMARPEGEASTQAP